VFGAAGVVTVSKPAGVGLYLANVVEDVITCLADGDATQATVTLGPHEVVTLLFEWPPADLVLLNT